MDFIINFDKSINAILYSVQNAFAVKIFSGVTLLGEITTIIVLTVLVSIYLWLSQKKWQTAGLWISIIGSASLTYVLKNIIERPRPLNALLLEESFSFPSGHATIAVAFYGYLAYLLIRSLKKKSQQRLVAAATLLIVAVIGFSRLYLRVHYPTDVLAGYLVGFIWLFIAIRLTKHNIDK